MSEDMLHQDVRNAVERAARLLDAEGKAPALGELAAAVGYSPFHLQRAFKRVTGLSPAEFARALREERAVRALQESGSVTEAIYDAGYESPARFYAAMQRRLGMAPSAWRKGGAGVAIGWTVLKTTLGPALLAVTEKGICRLSFNEDATELQRHFPNAELAEGAVPQDLADKVLKVIEQPATGSDLPLDVEGTPFQQRVWAQLRTIPAGETRSYAEIAAVVCTRKASRAVGGANGANPIAVLVPCHRVVASDGSLGGYAYGTRIKEELLRRERQA